MKVRVGFVGFLALVVSMAAQNSARNGSAAVVSVPPVIQFSNIAADESGRPLSGTEPITFSLYNSAQGGEPLWTETQSITLDSSGHYSVYLGITKKNGLPATLFTTGQALWLGVQAAGETEQPRVALVSVPYAMKAGDAVTVGGLPPSAFVRADAASSGRSAGKKANPASETQSYIPVFIDNSGDLGNSLLYQSGTTAVGIGTTTPSATLEVNGTAKFDGLASFASGQTFPGTLTGITAGTGITVTGSKTNPTVGINTTFANEFYAQLGASNTFTKGQTVNGTMTATTFSGNGSALTNVNASQLGGLASSAFAQLAAANNFTANQTVNGNLSAVQLISTEAQGTAPLQVISTTQVSNLNASLLGGLSASAFQPAGSYATLGPNTFTGNQSVTGIVTASGAVSGSSYQIGSNLFDTGSYSNENVFLGFAGSSGSSNAGRGNTASGYQALFNSISSYSTAYGAGALFSNTNASYNTASGYDALYNNTTGNGNTALGYQALLTNGTGGNNTAIGFSAGPGAANLSYATAIGANALVSESNAMVLGGTGAAAVNVGIGTATPAYPLDVAGIIRTSSGGIKFPDGTVQTTAGGTGTITGVTAGTDLTGGGTSGNVTLNVDTTKVPQLNAANTFTGNQTVNGNLNVSAGSSFEIGGSLFAFGSYTNRNAFLGFAGNSTTTGIQNTASGLNALLSDTTGGGNTANGYQTLGSNTSGSFNTASGNDALIRNTTGSFNTATGQALQSNTTGGYNTASGVNALPINTTGSLNTASGFNAGTTGDGSNLTGSNNTAMGAGAAFSTGTLTNATVIGSNAEVSESNALVLGCVAGVNSCPATVSVGIGTNAPSAPLHIAGPAGDPPVGLGAANNGLLLGLDSTSTYKWIQSYGGPLALNPIGNNVGIGTTTPGFALDVSGVVNTSTSFNLGGTAFAFGSATNGNAFLGFAGNPIGAGFVNTAVGLQALYSNITGNSNTALGSDALYNNTTGTFNTASGISALYLNTTGSYNSALGAGAGPDKNSPNLTNATAIGANAVVSESNAVVLGGTGQFGVNVGIGTATPAYTLDVTGAINSSTGFNLAGQPFAFGSFANQSAFFGFAGNSTMTGEYNTASGYYALFNNTTGTASTATGDGALADNTTGSNNTADGQLALEYNTTGGFNTAVGQRALGDNTTGSDLTCIGADCTANDGLSNATAIGAHAVVGESNALVLGGTGQWAVNVGIGTTAPTNILTIGRGLGHPISDSWETYSSRRWKTNIQTLPNALSTVERLRGVSYDLKDSRRHEIGVIAEEVGAVVPEVVTYEDNGRDARGVDYSRLTALLIEATKEQQALIRKQQQQIRIQQAQLKAQQSELNAQHARGQIQGAQIAELMSQMKAIQASLKTNERTGSEIRTVKAQTPIVQQ